MSRIEVNRSLRSPISRLERTSFQPCNSRKPVETLDRARPSVSQISSAVNVIVQASRLQDGSRRMTSITEITGMEGDVISMQELFKFQRTGLSPENKIIGHFTATGVRSHFSERFRMWGYDLPASIFEPFRGD